jgi:hypothetical protein
MWAVQLLTTNFAHMFLPLSAFFHGAHLSAPAINMM